MWARVLGKEVAVGLIVGAIMAVVAFGRAELLGTGAQVAQVVALTIAAICVWSVTVAAVLRSCCGGSASTRRWSRRP